MMKSMIMSAVATLACLVLFLGTWALGLIMMGKSEQFPLAPKKEVTEEQGKNSESGPTSIPGSGTGTSDTTSGSEEFVPTPVDTPAEHDRLEKIVHDVSTNGLEDRSDRELQELQREVKSLIHKEAKEILAHRSLLQEKSRDLETRAREVQAMQASLDKKIARLQYEKEQVDGVVKKARDEVAAWEQVKGEKKDGKDSGFARLTSMINEMKPDDASRVLQDMLFGKAGSGRGTPDKQVRADAVAILRNMDPSQSVKIINLMPDDKKDQVLKAVCEE